MAETADLGAKRLIGLNPQSWLEWVTGRKDLVAGPLLSTEFQWTGRRSDALLQVHRTRSRDFLMLNEIQLRFARNVPPRMKAYAGLAEERYGLPVYAVLVNLLPTPGPIPDRYKSELLGQKSLQEFRVINLWEVDVEQAFEPNLRTLLPFTPVLRGGGDEQTVRRALRVLQSDERLSELESLLAYFAAFALEPGLVQEIMRWDMATLEQNPWYMEALHRGEEMGKAEGLSQGLSQGLTQGLSQGLSQGLRAGLLEALDARFGSVPETVRQQVEAVTDADRLHYLNRRAVLDANLEEFRNALN